MDKKQSCIFVSDLHGSRSRYDKLFAAIAVRRPDILFLGGDLLKPVAGSNNSFSSGPDFADLDDIVRRFSELKAQMVSDYPVVFMILGNDDTRAQEPAAMEAEAEGVWIYIHGRQVETHGLSIFGYAFINPTPYHWKDWEKYDISRSVDPGCVSPEEGYRTSDASMKEIKYSTIAKDLSKLTGSLDPDRSICLFHAPPYRTNLDRAALDGHTIDHVPLDVNVGSMAVRRFIEDRQPLVTLHGHVHESCRLTGSWKDRIGETRLFSAAHDGPELALITFDPFAPDSATRELL